MIHKDDILETALNSGIKFAAKKYSISTETVLEIVNEFKEDIEDKKLCPCEESRKNGIGVICFFCTRPKERINI